jgi:dipeptidyl aminopeptidase/acylaminoacyl peptidase
MADQPAVAEYGSWASPFTAESLVADAVTLSTVRLGPDGRVLWLEARPKEGRSVLVGDGADLSPAPLSVRTRVHEYGGGAYTVAGNDVYASNFADNALYRLSPDAEPVLFHQLEGARYADGGYDPARGRLILVREDHRGEGEAVNTLVALDLTSGAETVLVEGATFYAAPRVSPDGTRLAWLSWNHPRMPWDGTELWVADIDSDGRPGPATLVAGGPTESIAQPEWAPDGSLVLVSDRTGWWNLYRQPADALGNADATVPLLPMEAEFAEPAWVFGRSCYAIAPDGRILASYTRNGDAHLLLLDPATGAPRRVRTPFTEIEEVGAGDGFAVFVGGSATEPNTLVRLDFATMQTTVLRRSAPSPTDLAYISVAQPIEFPTEHGLTAYAFFYPATNPDFVGPDGELPPLLVLSHGGPTAASTSTLRPLIQFWTSRGFGVVDVNYGGSTGYGREYRQRLTGTWGVVDVDDCVNAARYLVGEGLADPERLAIRGGSAGGYTTLCALAFHDYFKAGASYYGVGDAEALARDTHKFEARYLDSLIGPYPEAAALYRERSPIHHTERLSSALILFQGLDDKVVPPNQSETMYAAVKERGLPVAYLPFEGEGHGFRQAATIVRAAEAELAFYGAVFGFTPADKIEPFPIENLPA